jgi:serine/threonine-protein kinase
MVWQTGHLLNNGRYEILEVLGRGGFGLTYKARHCHLPIVVVIKTPDILQKRDAEYEDFVKQFEAEGRKLAKFSQNRHPHIVSISDFFIEVQVPTPVPCLVMDFIQGQTLMEKVKAQGKLSEAECLKYIRQIGSALEEVHQAGMVHRDAHPGNIMIQPNGNAILIDFGIAKEIIPASSSSTNSGANFSFAPYEQIFEHLQSRDRALENITSNRKPSVDIYTLSATFYYAITGQKPMPAFDRKSNNRLLVLPKEINRNLSEHLNIAITLGMSLEKENRPQSMSDWLQQLELPPPAVEPQYRQEKVNPPRSVKPEKEPEVAKQKPKVNRRSAQNSIQEKLKNVPWGLLGVFFVYGLSGYILGINSVPWQVVAVAGAGTVAGAMGFTDAGAGLWAGVLAGIWAIAGAGAWSGAGAVAVVWAGAVTGAVTGAWFWISEGTSIFDRWKNTDWYNGVNAIIVCFLPGIVSGITVSFLSKDIFLGIGIGGGSVVIFFVFLVQVFATSLNNKNFSLFNIFLIVAGTNLGGLGSGWLLAFLLHPKG